MFSAISKRLKSRKDLGNEPPSKEGGHLVRSRTRKNSVRTVDDVVSSCQDLLLEKMGNDISFEHPHASMVFCDIVGFTAWCAERTAQQVMDALSTYFQALDELCILHDLRKVETVGDGYVCVATNQVVIHASDSGNNLVSMVDGTHSEDTNGDESLDACSYARKAALFAVDANATIPFLRTVFDLTGMSLRVGVHSGPLVSGIVRSIASPPRYQFFGDTINVASRMESTAEAGMVQISKATKMLLLAANGGNGLDIRFRGSTAVKGKPPMPTFAISNGQARPRRMSTHEQCVDPLIRASSGRIMIARDLQSSSHRLAKYIHGHVKFGVHIAGNMERVISLLGEHAWDCVVCDATCEGIKVAEAVRNSNVKARIVALTGSGHDAALDMFDVTVSSAASRESIANALV